MPSLYVNAGDTSPIYIVQLNDGGSDGGSTVTHYVSPETGGRFTDEQMQAALQAYADSLASVDSYSVVSISKNEVVNTNL